MSTIRRLAAVITAAAALITPAATAATAATTAPTATTAAAGLGGPDCIDVTVRELIDRGLSPKGTTYRKILRARASKSPNAETLAPAAWVAPGSRHAHSFAGLPCEPFQKLTRRTVKAVPVGTVTISCHDDLGDDVACTPDAIAGLKGDKGDPGPSGPAGAPGPAGTAAPATTQCVPEPRDLGPVPGKNGHNYWGLFWCGTQVGPSWIADTAAG